MTGEYRLDSSCLSLLAFRNNLLKASAYRKRLVCDPQLVTPEVALFFHRWKILVDVIFGSPVVLLKGMSSEKYFSLPEYQKYFPASSPPCHSADTSSLAARPFSPVAERPCQPRSEGASML